MGVSRVGGNATDYQTNALPSGWKRVKSSPQPGDVIVWAGNTKINANYTLNKYGHIGIVVAVSGNNLTTVETNADGKVSYAQKVSRNASYAACFIRPNFSGHDDCVNVTTGNYYLKNQSTKTYMQAAGASNAAKLSLAAKKDTSAFQYNLTGSKAAGYYLATKLNTGYVVNPYSDTPTNGTVINIYKKDNSGTQIWEFDKNESGYIVHLKNNSNLCLTADGTSVVLKKRTNAANQIWILEDVSTTTTVKFHRNLNSDDTTSVTEKFTTGVSNQKFGYKTDGTGRYNEMNDASVGFGEWTNPGYKMLGWSKDKNATTASWKTYSSVIDSWITSNAPSVDLYAVWEKSILRGDANNNGEVNIADAVMLQKWILGSGDLTNWQNVDLCEDGVIDVFDMVIMRKLIIEK